MRLNPALIFLVVLLTILFTPSNSNAARSQGELQMEVLMRMIGHQVLLSSGDSSSIVLPIEKEDSRYRIQFDTELQFEPEELTTIVSRVLQEAQLDYSYIMAVEECGTCSVTYSYQVGGLQHSNIVPCQGRELPKACYSLLFTRLESDYLLEPLTSSIVGTAKNSNDQRSQMAYSSLALLIVLGVGMFVVLRNKRLRSKTDPNIIALGAYQFDKRNTELVHDQRRIELTSKEADLLILLFDAVNTAITREALLERVWGDEGDYVGRTLDVFISKLRKKLAADPKVKIVNIRGVGYKLVVGM